VWLSCAIFFSFLLTGCGEHKPATANVPPPPSLEDQETSPQSPVETAALGTGDLNEDKNVPRPPSKSKPILVESGMASWYGPPYNHHRASNGQVYDMNAMTAAHRTLPLDSIVRVTNLKTGHSAVVRITDRGPFIEGRILDLSEAAAKKTDVWLAGVAMVRMEVLRTPVPLDRGGRWAVQIGGFEKQHAADKEADHLSHRFRDAKVQCFSSPVGSWWVRVRVQDDARELAEEVLHHAETSQGAIFLVRLD